MSELKLKWNPEVYIVSRPVINFDSVSEFLVGLDPKSAEWESDSLNHADEIPEIAGRLCYMSYDKPRPGGNTAYLQHIKEVGHGSVLEHTNFGFIFSGVSRSLTHELVRHRAGMAYSMLSQRYVDESDVAFVVPWELQEEVQAAVEWTTKNPGQPPFADTISVKAQRGYDWLLTCRTCLYEYRRTSAYLSDKFSSSEADATTRRKMAQQTARSVLPNCTETKIFVTGNARAWRHFLEMRGSRHAEVEIRRLASEVLDLLQREAPNLFSDYHITGLPDGTVEINTPYRKV